MPPRMFLYYDRIYHIRRLVEKNQTEELFDAEKVAEIWGERETVRRIKGLLNRLKRRGYNDARIAEYLGISRASVSQWRSGRNQPSVERMGQLEELASEAGKEGESTNMPTNKRLTKAPIEAEKMPVPISIINANKDVSLRTPRPVPHDAPSPSESVEGTAKTGPACEKCPLRGQPRVGGRGGVKL